MLFDKYYNCYYQIVGRILAMAQRDSITVEDMYSVCSQYGFEESGMYIVPKLVDGTWKLLKTEDGIHYRSCLKHPYYLPMTKLQKSWLKALIMDERIGLFLTDENLEILSQKLSEVKPLFPYEAFIWFDRFLDGDPYTSVEYRDIFQRVIHAIDHKKVCEVKYKGRTNHQLLEMTFYPIRIQYSSKDDKFRAIGLQILENGDKRNTTLNMAGIINCTETDKEKWRTKNFEIPAMHYKNVTFEINSQRNSLERCMLHFSNYEKHTEFDREKGCYVCTVYYDKRDETELLIQILSFGPVVRVTQPESFIGLIRERVMRQHELLK